MGKCLMKTWRLLVLAGFFGAWTMACAESNELLEWGKHYQKYRDYESLQKVVDGIALGVDTSMVRDVLGEPIDMGFDYRYTLDSVGPNGCTLGAVFHIDDQGKIDQKWLDEICE